MAKKWAAFPHPDKSYVHDAAGLKKHWARLHRGDCEPFPKDAGVVDAWRHFHAGAFADAVDAGRKAGGAGIDAAVKAQMIYANYLEKSDKAKLALLEEAAAWAEARRSEAPKLANAHYLYAYALGRYSQGISITKALGVVVPALCGCLIDGDAPHVGIVGTLPRLLDPVVQHAPHLGVVLPDQTRGGRDRHGRHQRHGKCLK